MFSPSGAKLAFDYSGDSCYNYLGGGGSDPRAGLYLSDLDGAHRRRIKGGLLMGWLSSGRLIASQVSGSKLRVLHALSGGLVMTLPGSDQSYANGQDIAVSCSGRVAAVQTNSRPDELDLLTRVTVRVRGAVRVRVAQRRIIMKGFELDSPAWSPDGRSVVFARVDAGSSGFAGGLWIVGANGRGLRPLPHPKGVQDSVEGWSPDGHRVLFERAINNDSQTTRALVVNADGSHAHVIANLSDDLPAPVERVGTWSPDGQSIAFDAPTNFIGDVIVIINATTGAVQRTIPFGGNSVQDWQALPGGRSVRCAAGA